jgi:hypothetical protein
MVNISPLKSFLTPLASFISCRDIKKGFTITSKPLQIFEIFLKGIYALSKEIDFADLENCTDFLYFKENNMAIAAI